MDSALSHTGLSQLLDREMRLVTDLTGALEAEQRSLGDNDHEGLLAVIARKQAIIDSLNEADKARAQLLEHAGCAPDQAGIESYIDRQPEPSRRQLKDLWRRLLEAVADCQRRNLINGSIIGMNLRHCAQAVSVLRGRDPRQELYDLRGNASSTPRRGHPIKA